MSELCSCNCGSRQFERLSEKIICSKCKKDIDTNGTAGFFDPSDSKSKEFITLLGIDIGAEAATVHTPVVGSNKPFVGFNRSEGDKYLGSFLLRISIEKAISQDLENAITEYFVN